MALPRLLLSSSAQNDRTRGGGVTGDTAFFVDALLNPANETVEGFL